MYSWMKRLIAGTLLLLAIQTSILGVSPALFPNGLGMVGIMVRSGPDRIW